MENTSYNNNMSNIPGEFGSSSVSFIDWIRSITWPVWLLFFIILAFLGFNVLTLISRGSGDIGSWLNNIINKIKNTGKIINTIKNTIFVSATGTKGLVDTTAKVSDEILENVKTSTEVGNIPTTNPLVTPQTPISNTATSSIPSTSVTKQNSSMDISQSNTLNRALNTKQSNIGNMDYEADDTLSNIQSAGSKSGWCYIGEDRGFRSCAEVNSSEQCMSGDIFPTNEICINPNLRQ